MARRTRTRSRTRSNVRAARPTLPPLPSLADPPQAQIDNNRVSRAEWVDPAQLLHARTRTVKHYRTYCPVRSMAERLNATGIITYEHVAACDRLRGLFEAASLGLSGKRMQWVYFERSMIVPTTPTPAALRQARAHARVRTCLKHFTPAQQELLHHVVLLCVPLGRWRRDQGHCTWRAATRQLVEVLDKLVAYFQRDIEKFGLPA